MTLNTLTHTAHIGAACATIIAHYFVIPSLKQRAYSIFRRAAHSFLEEKSVILYQTPYLIVTMFNSIIRPLSLILYFVPKLSLILYDPILASFPLHMHAVLSRLLRIAVDFGEPNCFHWNFVTQEILEDLENGEFLLPPLHNRNLCNCEYSHRSILRRNVPIWFNSPTQKSPGWWGVNQLEISRSLGVLRGCKFCRCVLNTSL